MQSLRLTKKIVLAAAAAATLSIAMLAGLTIDGTVLAQEHPCVSMPATPRGPVMMTPADVEEGLRTGNLPDGGYLPVVKLMPRYPAEAAARRLQGYVIVDYTVGTDGSTEDVRVIESSSSLFEAAALETAARYQYKPCVMDGAPLAYPGVRTTIVFRLEGIDEPGPRALNRPLGETIIVTGQLPTNDENEG